MKMTTESMKASMHRRVLWGAVLVIGLAVLIGGQFFGLFKPLVGDAHYADFMAGLQMGLLVGLELVAVFYLAKYVVAMGDEQKMRAMFIKENDERTIFIEQQIGRSSYKYVVSGLVAAAVVAGYFSAATFAALLGAALFEALVRIVLYAYYSKKV